MRTREIVVQKWGELSRKPLTESNVRELHSPLSKYRVSLYRYPAGAEVHGLMRAGTCYVLQGRGQYRYATEEERGLHAEDVARLPEGSYELKVAHDSEFVIVLVWELPGEFAGI